MLLQFIVNGAPRDVDVAPDTPLLWVLRDELGLTGTKYGCGVGACGACTIHLDDKPGRACSMPAAAAAGKRITTIEGLGATGLHRVQRAWLAEDVAQCGYCQAGQLMAAAALLAAHPAPTDAEIDAAMEGNLCRCGSYQRIRRAIHLAATLPASVPQTRQYR
jgi:isoquinoline 1-oxidoreductase subunit alpha